MAQIQGRPMAELSILDMNAAVADPDIFCGGGSIAALTASSAAALTRLVLGLAAKRKSNRDYQDAISAAATRVLQLEAEVASLADRDIEVLDDLLKAQRSLKKTDDRSEYARALKEAAESPVLIARACLELLEIITAQMDRATRFTVSDLGAAAALAQGAARAAIFTSEVNVALLENEDTVSLGTSTEALALDIADVLSSVDALSTVIYQRTLAVIRKEQDKG